MQVVDGASILRFVASVKRVEESDSFKKTLARLSEHDQRAWERTKKKLADSAAVGGLDFHVPHSRRAGGIERSAGAAPAALLPEIEVPSVGQG